MDYIELSQADIDYIDNRTVICYYDAGFVAFEPLHPDVSTHFEERVRKVWIDLEAVTTNTIEL